MRINLETFNKIVNDFENYKDYQYQGENYLVHFIKEDNKIYLECEDIPRELDKEVTDGKIEELLEINMYIQKSIKKLQRRR